MKAKLLNILSQCVYNKSSEDFNVLLKLINIINDEVTEDLNIKINDTSVYLSFFNGDYRLTSVSFTDNNKLLFTLPDNIIKTYIIDNCSYNIQYDEIRALLNSNN